MDDTTTDTLKRAGSGAATGAAYGGVPGALVGAGVSVLGPLVAKGLGSMFGLDQPSGPEQEALARLKNQASGATQSPAQLMLASQRAKTQQTLASLAARGTAQQQAGNVRAAMQAAPEIQQQQAGQLAALRAHEMAQAQQQLAQMQASMGANDRKYMQGLIGAGVSGAAGAGAMAMTQSPEVVKKVAAVPKPAVPVQAAAVPAAVPAPAAAPAAVPAPAEMPASGGRALRDQNIGAGIGYRAPQGEQDTLLLGQPNVKTKGGRLQARGQGLAAYLTNGTLGRAGDMTLTPPFLGY